MSDKQSNRLPKILGERFKEAREEHGLSIQELANKAILSTSQIRQIESNELGAFYSPAIKHISAQKVAKILGLSEDEAFNPNETDLNHDSLEFKEQRELVPIQGIEMPEPKRSKIVLKVFGVLLLVTAGLGCGYYLFNPFTAIS